MDMTTFYGGGSWFNALDPCKVDILVSRAIGGDIPLKSPGSWKDEILAITISLPSPYYSHVLYLDLYVFSHTGFHFVSIRKPE
jgi:hypothetical protein